MPRGIDLAQLARLELIFSEQSSALPKIFPLSRNLYQYALKVYKAKKALDEWNV